VPLLWGFSFAELSTPRKRKPSGSSASTYELARELRLKLRSGRSRFDQRYINVPRC
jgi:hypothetical protein